ncbi:MAG: 50S ribosomal protein L11 methyltransferase [Oligoflexia bacterium]|nr:50S ribosomal protein L11 methyltransferase [Oligoflexia bacterium]
MRRLSPQVTLLEPGEKPSKAELRESVLVLSQLPSAAFGDGSHPTTRLCAGAVDLLCRQRAPEAVLDVGTGTGVLARIARARGARFIAATDIDAAAIQAARANAALDAHPVEIEFSGRAPDHWGPRFDLVIANILEGPLRELAPALSRALAPGGVLCLSGFTRLQAPALRIAFEAQGLTYWTEAALEEWVLLALRTTIDLSL